MYFRLYLPWARWSMLTGLCVLEDLYLGKSYNNAFDTGL